MNDIERRTLLSAAGIGAIAALAKAGPLNPPPGAVAPTGRTFDEVYNKIATPPSVGAYDGRTPIPGGTSEVLINQPGSYLLTGPISISPSGSGITVTAPNVTLDLNGHTISGAPIAWSGVRFNANAINGVVRNGRITGFFHGVYQEASAPGLLVEDLQVQGCGAIGIVFLSGQSRCRRCFISAIGSSSLGTIRGVQVAANACVIEECTIHSLTPGVSTTVRGIDVSGQGNAVDHCTVTHHAALVGAAFYLNGTGIYRNNCAIYYSSAYTGAGWGNGGGNV